MTIRFCKQSGYTIGAAQIKRLWHDHLVDRESVTNPFDVEKLRPGWYRLRDPS